MSELFVTTTDASVSVSPYPTSDDRYENNHICINKASISDSPLHSKEVIYNVLTNILREAGVKVRFE